MKKVLTIAGSDSCGGAGIQADIKTMSALGVYAMSIITAVTAQNTMGVFNVLEINKEMVESQIDCIFKDISVDAIKIGMVSNKDIINTIKEKLIEYKGKNIVVDPVMISKSGYFLLKEDAVEELKALISISDLVTPNIPEAEVLSRIKIKDEEDMKKSAEVIRKIGAKNVLIKGGHSCGNSDDILYDGNKFYVFKGERIDSRNTHGTGCTLSSAIASCIAKGCSLERAIDLSKRYINTAIKNSFSIGEGVGPVGHFVELYDKAGMDY